MTSEGWYRGFVPVLGLVLLLKLGRGYVGLSYTNRYTVLIA